MLRKLFISLLILSALTSDASAFSALMLSAGLNPDCILSQFESSRIQPEKAVTICVKADKFSQPVTPKYRLVSLLPENLSASRADSFYILSDFKEFQFENRHIIFSSDPSPPVC